jgi:hypothetical protein
MAPRLRFPQKYILFIFFAGISLYFLNHFKGYFVGTKTFFTPKLSKAQTD